ncbi:MAG: ATP/GTP-binding protein [Actinomycetaceae bacterium]|nr:ATP/GTP-binding protein [Actinomycetaceae bacterium]
MRRSKKYSRPVRPLNVGAAMGGVRRETGRDGTEYKVRHIPSGSKEYRCPGCDLIIAAGLPHEVVWTEDTLWGAQYGIDSRRHWHTACWRQYARG